jgi:transcriptional regulator
MDKSKVDLLQGTLDMLIMKALAGASMHGFGVARWIESVTGDRLTVDEGALYPALHRMEKRGWLASEWRMTENRRRAKYYSVTSAGSTEFTAQVKRWSGSSWAVESVLERGEA